MFRLHRLALISRSLCPFPKIVKHHENVLKLGRISSGSGCLLAGCCFSRQPDEEPILDSVKEDHGYLSKARKKKQLNFNSDFPEHATFSKDMKRSFEAVNDIAEQDAVTAENLIPVVDACYKKRKTGEGDKIPNENILQELPESKCASSSHPTTTAEPPKAHLEKAEVETKKPKTQRPNYFVAVKISDDQIHQTLTELQAHILQKEDRLKKSMIELKTLHITLMVMYIGDTETHARAMKALENIHQEHDEEMSRNPIKLEFQGLGHFQNRVLYAKLLPDDSYQRLCLLAESVKEHFASASIPSTDSRPGFTPHLTVAKIDFKKRQNKLIKKINPSLYKDFNDQYFGSQKVVSIELLSMLDPKNEVGYYSGNEIFFSAFDPRVRRNSLNELLETEERKKNVKEMINALMKEKMK